MDDIFTKIDFPELVGTLHDHKDSKVIRSYGMACARLAYKTSQDNQQAEITSLRAELEKAKKDGWISIDTALPDDEITFLSFSPVYGFQVNVFNIHGNGGLPKLAQLKITHWQPLPSPPKE